MPRRSQMLTHATSVRTVTFSGLLAALVAVLAVCAVFTVASGVQPRSSVPASRVALTWPGADTKHINVVLNYARQRKTPSPTVYMLGGSSARESTVCDRDWRRKIRETGGPYIRAFNLGSTNQTFRDDVNIVKALPDGPTLILIGVNLGRFTQGDYHPFTFKVTNQSLTLDQVDAYPQHRFDGHYVASDAHKVGLVKKWLSERYPVFRRNFAFEADRLRELVATCQSRGFKVVIFNLPYNRAIIGHRLDAPMMRCERVCRSVAAAYNVPYVDFVSKVPLVSRDFADNSHLLQAGRVKWQRRLTVMTVYWLKRFGIPAPTASPTPTETASPTPTASPTESPTPTDSPAPTDSPTATSIESPTATSAPSL